MPDHIQIGDTAPRIQYTGDGAQTAFSYPFPIFKDSDIEVWLDGEKQSSGYTVAGAGGSTGGTVTFTAAPAAGVLVTLRRRLVIQRTSDFQAAALQQLAADLGRAVTRSATSASTADLTLPEPVAGRALKWSADGTALANSDNDPDAQVTLATAQAEAAATSATQAAASVVAAQTAQTNAETAEANAETAQAAAEAAAVAAIAAVGGVKVTANDTTAAPLDTKIAVSGLVGKAVANAGGAEGLALDVPVADQEQAEAGVASNVAMTPQRVAQAIAALAVSKVVQVVTQGYAAVSTGTTTIPLDDTIPQNTEGDEYMSITINNVKAGNTLRVSGVACLANSSAAQQTMHLALFKDAEADARFATASQKQNFADAFMPIPFDYSMVLAADAASVTFKVRAGLIAAGTTTFNGSGGSRKFGATVKSHITVMEIKP